MTTLTTTPPTTMPQTTMPQTTPAAPGDQGRLGKMHLGKLLMWVFLASDVMGFASMIAAFFYLRIQTVGWPVSSELLNITLTGVNTVFLLSSSFTIAWAVGAARKDDAKGVLRWLLITIGLGGLFLAIQIYEYVEITAVFSAAFDGRPFSGHLFASTFFLLTGFHALHVLVGLIYLSCLVLPAVRGRYTAKDNAVLDIAALFWHFVDWVWVAIFTSVYILN